MVSYYLVSALILFFASFLVEFAIVSLILWKLNRKIFGIVFLINLFTWPIANFFYGTGLNLFIVEGAVVILEGFLLVMLLDIRRWKAGVISLVANSVSTFLGYILAILLSPSVMY